MKKLFFVMAMLVAFATAYAGDDDLAAIKAMLTKMNIANPDSIKASPVKGLYEVAYGTEIYYMSADGRYLVSGEMHDLSTKLNITEEHRKTARKTILDAVDPKSMIIFKPKGEIKHVITVFTDIDCGYCRKLHSGMQEMNDLGIEVRYLSFPRAGINSPSYNKAVSVWCADDPREALTLAKADKPVAVATCDNPVKDEWQLGKKLGVTGTPAIFLEDGTLLPGYMPPSRLLQTLETHGG